jgi:hypothetical protein
MKAQRKPVAIRIGPLTYNPGWKAHRLLYRRSIPKFQSNGKSAFFASLTGMVFQVFDFEIGKQPIARFFSPSWTKQVSCRPWIARAFCIY